jgi:hypothetical protein
MNVELSERDKDTDTTPYERCITEEVPEYLGERGERKQVLDGRRGKKVQNLQ